MARTLNGVAERARSGTTDLAREMSSSSDALAASVRKTNRMVVVEEGWPQCGVGAEISAVVNEDAFDHLDAPVERITGVDVPMPYAQNLEERALPTVDDIVRVARRVTYRD